MPSHYRHRHHAAQRPAAPSRAPRASIGLGHKLPDRVVPNGPIAERIGVDSDWIVAPHRASASAATPRRRRAHERPRHHGRHARAPATPA